MKSIKDTRVYTAKTLGNTELYILRKEVLETLLNMKDILGTPKTVRQTSLRELNRICHVYTDRIIKH